jgi:hypothetical protein
VRLKRNFYKKQAITFVSLAGSPQVYTFLKFFISRVVKRKNIAPKKLVATGK